MTIRHRPGLRGGDGTAGGVIDYSFGNYKLLPSATPAATAGNLPKEVTAAAAPGQLMAGTMNVENLAGLLVGSLQSPDIVAIQEIQDNNGATNEAIVAADQTWTKLISAITAAGGPAYQYRQIDPVDGQDGGAPGGNIRQGFLFRADRGLAFVDQPLFGVTQPPVRSSETQRHNQAAIVHNFVQQITSLDATAKVIVHLRWQRPGARPHPDQQPAVHGAVPVRHRPRQLGV